MKTYAGNKILYVGNKSRFAKLRNTYRGIRKDFAALLDKLENNQQLTNEEIQCIKRRWKL